MSNFMKCRAIAMACSLSISVGCGSHSLRQDPEPDASVDASTNADAGSAFAPSLVLIAGALGGPGSLDGTGANARFAAPYGVAVDAAGNVFVADAGNDTIRKITPSGVVTTFAGSAGVSGSADGTGASARFYQPAGLAVDSAGTLYVADTGNSTIRKITAAGVVTTLAGTPGVVGHADGVGSAATFTAPKGVAVDGTGTVIVADTGSSAIRTISTSGVVSTLAGQAGTKGSTNGTGSAAKFSLPTGVAIDGAGNIFVADRMNSEIRKVTPAGVVTSFAGAGAGYSGLVDGTGSAARFDYPAALTVDAAGNVYVVDNFDNTLRVVTPGGVVTTLRAAQSLVQPSGIAIDGSGNLVVADTGNFMVRHASVAGVLTNFAGAALAYGAQDGAGTTARFNTPTGVAVSATGEIYVSDNMNGTLRAIDSATLVTTVAGNAGAMGSADGTGGAARFTYPWMIAFGPTGDAFVSDSLGTIRRIAPTGVVTTFAGTAGTLGSADGNGSAASFSRPAGIAIDSAGDLFVVDTDGETIRKITPDATVTTFAGSDGVIGSADGAGAAASFNRPTGIAIDGAGNLYVADTDNGTIREITPAGVVTTIAGKAGAGGYVDGSAADSRFDQPIGVAADAAGNVYVTDIANRVLRKIAPDRSVTTLVGVRGSLGVAPGALPASLAFPEVSSYESLAVAGGIALAPSGNLVITAEEAVLEVRLHP